MREMCNREKSLLDAIGNTPMNLLRRIWDADTTGVRFLSSLKEPIPEEASKTVLPYR